jgi:hypothetical protein
MRNAYRILAESSEGKTPLRRPRHRWEGDIKIDLKEIGWEGVDWIHLARPVVGAIVNIVMNLWVP